MALDISQVGTLLGSSTVSKRPSLYDLVNGSSQSTTAALLGGLSTQKTSSLTTLQSGALASLKEYVEANVSGPEADTLFASIEALQRLLELGNQDSTASIDPVFSLLANNPNITGTLPGGTLVDQLL